MDSKEVLVRFRTSLKDPYVVPENDLTIPSSVQRYALSEVLNKLLGRETPVPFDFLIENKFLRTSLQQWLISEKKTAEETIELEYVLAVPPIETSPKDAGEDWISRCMSLGGESSASISYDGHLRLHESLATQTIQISSQALTALGGDSDRLVIAAADGQVYFTDGKGVVVGSGEHHTQGVDAASLSADKSTAATGGWDKIIALWNCDELVTSSSKKRKRAQTPAGLLDGHKESVSCIRFGVTAKHTLLSTSLDNSMKMWDTALGSCVNTWNTGKHATSFSNGPSGEIVMAHEDGRITIWDTRTEGGLQLEHRITQRPHRSMCPEVVWAKQNANAIASISHDSTVKLLDPRCLEMPLFSINLADEPIKGLCLDFMDPFGRSLISGASDGKVRIHRQKT